MNGKRLITSSLAVVVAGVVILVITVSGGSASKLKPTAVQAGGSIALKHTSLGNILVAANGRTLYLFKADKTNHSTLSRAGFAVWPAYTASGKPRAGAGVNAAHIGIISTNGSKQVTYYGHPLYYYVGDKGAGETNGQGLKEFGALWWVLGSHGNAVTTTHTTVAPSSSEESSGYSY